MLRYLASGPRNFITYPVPPSSERLNWEFYCISDGLGAPCFLSGKSPPLRSGALWLLPPRLNYGWQGDEKGCFRLSFHFTQVPEEVSGALGDRRYLVEDLDEGQIKALVELAAELEPHWKSPHSHSHLFYDKALLQLSIAILKNQPLKRDIPLEMLASERVERATAWFSACIARNPTIDEVAAALHMTGTHLRRLFKAVRRKSPHQVFREIQIKRACDLLSTTQLTQEEIARRSGFKSVTDFARVFRSEIGTPADKWRRTITTAKTIDSSRIAARNVRIS